MLPLEKAYSDEIPANPADRVWQRVESRLPQAQQRTFRIGRCDFECLSDQAAQLNTVGHFVPWGGVSSLGEPRIPYRLISLVEPELVQEILEDLEGREPDRTIETFAGEAFHAQYGFGAQGTFFVETGPAPERRYLMLKAGRRIAVLLADGRLISPIMRALREVYLRESENLGGIVLHAAAFVYQERATVLVGAKAAGKTSLVLAASLTPGFSFLGNDRVLLVPGEEGLEVLPFPLSCRIGVGTAEAMAPVRDVFARRESLYRRQDARLDAADRQSALLNQQFGSGVKLELTPLELETLLGVRHHAGARLGRFVLPRLDADCRHPELAPAGDAALLEELRPQVFTPHEEKWVNPWLVERKLTPPELEARSGTLLRQALSASRGYRLRYGFDYWSEGGLNEELRRLLEAPPR